MIRPCDQYGPWMPGLDPAEYRARLRAIVRLSTGPRGAHLDCLLRQAEREPEALEPALGALDILASPQIAGVSWRATPPFTSLPEEPAMSSNVIPFLSAPRTPPSGMVRISVGTVTTSTEAGDVGQFLYILTFVDPEGGEMSVWDGSTQAGALEAAREWESDGAMLVDETITCVQ